MNAAILIPSLVYKSLVLISVQGVGEDVSKVWREIVLWWVCEARLTLHPELETGTAG